MNRYCIASFKKLDIFGSEISLNYNKDNLFRTPFGGFVALGCILILTILFFNNVMTLIEKSEVKYISSLNYDYDPDVIEVGIDNFMIAVKYDQKNFINRPMFNITFEKRHYHRNANGTLTQKKIPVPMEPCTLEHFIGLPNHNINWTSTFDQQGLNDYLCLRKGESFKIGGTYQSQDFYHIKYVMKKCVNQTNPVEKWKPVCDTPENIDKADEDARIQFLYSNTLLRPENPTSSITTFLDQLIFNVQPQIVIH